MRIIAGLYRSRTLQAPSGLATRPSSDRLRETLFNVLAPRIEGAAFLDLYAGSGAVGIEALSRGASQAVLVERAPAALKALRGNLTKLGISGGFRIDSSSVAAALKHLSKENQRFDLVFLDPPWDAVAEYAATLKSLGDATNGLLADGALVIAEHRRKECLEERYGALERTRLLEQGDAALSFFTVHPMPKEGLLPSMCANSRTENVETKRGKTIKSVIYVNSACFSPDSSDCKVCVCRG
jgi:16S rRNA (guanine(966)-N(2))-methyltransferase RsmD